MNNNILLVDFDETLTFDVAWTPEECLKCKPRLDTIKAINQSNKYIIIYTARKDELQLASIQWLRTNGVHFHATNFGTKVPGIIFDLDAINKLEDL